VAALPTQTTESFPAYDPRRFSRLATAVVLLCAVLPYLGTLHYQFAYDDDTQVLDNPVIGSWRFLPAYFTKPVAGFFHGVHAARYYRPLFFVWLRLNYAAWGTHSVGWHVTNLVLHAAASLLALAILRRYFAHLRWAVAGAALFAVHPAHVETVAWVSGCTDSLMAVSLFGSLLLWMRGEESQSRAARAISLLCYALALLSKETAVVLPILIFLHALLGVSTRCGVNGGKYVYALRSAMPYVPVTAIFLTVRHFVLRGVPTGAMWVWPSHALLTIPSLLLFYARHLLWPVNLTLFYDLPIVSSAASAAFLIPVLTLGILCVALCFAFYRRCDSRGLLAGAWFFLPLAPLLYIAEFQRDDFVHDRYLYLPVLALSILLGCMCEWLERSAISRQLPRLPVLVPAALITLFALLTVVEARPWENDLTLYLNAVRVSPKHPLARNNLAREYEQIGRFNDAEALLAGLVQERPDLWLANYNYGYVNYRLGKFPAAESYLQRAVQIDPREPDQHLYLGATYLKQGRLGMAETQLRTAIASNPEGAGYHYTLGVIYWQQGRLAAAQEELALELQYHPENAGVRAQLEALKTSMGQSLH
jgi:tetratricopeptide (TPR) repeat protein